jgi:hypothetical protein
MKISTALKRTKKQLIAIGFSKQRSNTFLSYTRDFPVHVEKNPDGN